METYWWTMDTRLAEWLANHAVQKGIFENKKEQAAYNMDNFQPVCEFPEDADYILV